MKCCDRRLSNHGYIEIRSISSFLHSESIKIVPLVTAAFLISSSRHDRIADGFDSVHSKYPSRQVSEYPSVQVSKYPSGQELIAIRVAIERREHLI